MTLHLNFISNIRIKSILSITKLNKSNFLFSRRILAFFLLFSFLYKDKNIISLKIFVKPKKLKKFNILRAPYKNKIAQNSFMWNRYYYSIIFLFKNEQYFSSCDLIDYFNILIKSNHLLSTNISNIKSIRVSSNFFLKI